MTDWCLEIKLLHRFQSSVAQYFNISNRHRMWTQHRLWISAIKTNIEWHRKLISNSNISLIFRYLVALYWNSSKTCSFKKSRGVFIGLFWLLAINQLYSKIEYERTDIESNPKSWHGAALPTRVWGKHLWNEACIPQLLWNYGPDLTSQFVWLYSSTVTLSCFFSMESESCFV